MYYTGLDPRTMEKVYIPDSQHEKAMQRALLQYNKKENYNLVYEALKKVGRDDLIGYGGKCLIKPKGKQNISDRNDQHRIKVKPDSKTMIRKKNDIAYSKNLKKKKFKELNDGKE
jgi:hypothetical protein